MVVGNAVRQLWVWSFRWAILVPSPSWLMRPGTTMLLGNDWHIVLPTVHQTLWCKTLNIIFLYIYVHFKAIASMNVWYIYIYIITVHVLLIRCGILSPYGDNDLENIDSCMHWNENVFILMKSSSLAAPKVVKMTTFGAASDETFIKMKTFSFQCVMAFWLFSGEPLSEPMLTYYLLDP